MKFASLPSFLVIGLMLCLSPNRLLLAQTVPPSASAVCGITELTPAQATSLIKDANQALQRKRASNPSAFSTLTYVPIRPHIVRRSNGTGGYPLASINQVIALTNKYYLQNGFGIQFYFAGSTPDYVDDDGLYASFPFGEGSTVDSHDAHDAMNQYYVNNIQGGYGGYAAYPGDYLRSTHSFIQTYGETGNDDYLGNYTIPHELGHNFNLLHTFGPSNGESVTNELVTRGQGANCETAGDYICDTPADPWGMPGLKLFYVGDHCLQYDPTSTTRDPNGEVYTPPVGNIMAYYNTCTHYFTPGQYDRIQAGLALRQSHTSYSLTAPATNVSPPTNLNLSFDLVSSVVLTWLDNATNEMGYFIERSTSPTTGFLPIGGVAPDVTTFTDNQVVLNTRYYYRIRPSNSTQNNLSPTASVSTNPCPAPYYPGSNPPARTTILIGWTGNTGQTNTLRWRPAGTPNWNTINNIPNGQYSTTYSLTGLASNTAYEWQVQGVCSATSTSDFTDIQSFTTLTCQVPSANNVINIGGASAQFSWYTPFEEVGRTAEIRYRIVGAPLWTTVSSVSSVSFNSAYVLTGLGNNTTYEWQMRNVCSAAEMSPYTTLATFTTFCRIPTGLFNNPTATRASLGWSISSAPDIGTAYEIHYRPVGSTIWSSIIKSVATGTTGSLSLTGLTTNTQYEWQVRTACSASSLSDYSITKQFTTTCNTPITSALSTSLWTSNGVQLIWYTTNDPGTQYDIRYRPTGATNWATVSVTTSGTYNLTGLSNNTTYEWQIRSACSPTSVSDFVAGPNFTTQCRIPSYLFANPQITSAILNWEQTGTDVTYNIRYRIVGSANWTTLSTITSFSLNLTGLTSNTNYEYQVQGQCSGGITTDFSSVRLFTTSSCDTPALYASMITASSVQLNGFYFYAYTVDIRYRVVGALDWITLNNLPIANGTGYLTLTGLSSSTTYEYQARNRCSAIDISAFSSSLTFQTLTSCPIMYTTKDGLWNDPTLWSCNHVPVTGDVVQIKHQVIIPASYVATVRRVGVDAGKTVTYGTNAQMKLGF